MATLRNEAYEAELARLREENDRLKSNLLALDTAAVKRYDTLLAALREIRDTPAEVEVAGECAYCESKYIARTAISEVEGEPTDAEVVRGVGRGRGEPPPEAPRSRAQGDRCTTGGDELDVRPRGGDGMTDTPTNQRPTVDYDIYRAAVEECEGYRLRLRGRDRELTKLREAVEEWANASDDWLNAAEARPYNAEQAALTSINRRFAEDRLRQLIEEKP